MKHRTLNDAIWYELFGKPAHAIDVYLSAALTEDIASGDLTTELLFEGHERGKARLIAKEPCILAGALLFERVFQLLDPDIQSVWYFEDGSKIPQNSCVAEFEGKLIHILGGERTALNILQRLSGIATTVHAYVEKVRPYGTRILDTRKTTPLWRWAEKYAVQIGGGMNHRKSLSDGILIKENHIRCVGGLEKCIQKFRAHEHEHFRFQPEIEVENLEEFKKALEAGFSCILLDNMSVEEVRQAVEMAEGKAWLEASGGIHLDNVEDYAKTGVHAISIGALTHSVQAIDFSLEVYPLEKS